MSAGIDGDDAFEAFVRGSWSMRHPVHPEKSNLCTARELGQQATVDDAGRGGEHKPSTVRRRHEEDNPAGNKTPSKILRANSRVDDVPFSARDGSTASGHRHGCFRGEKKGDTAAIVHPAKCSTPTVSRAGGRRRSVPTPPRAKSLEGGTGHTGATNAANVREREGSAARSSPAARRDGDEPYIERGSARVEKCTEGRSAHVGGVTSQAGERRMVQDGHRRRQPQPATHGARRGQGNTNSGDGGGSRSSRQEQAHQRQKRAELKGYRVEPAGIEFERQQKAAAAGFRAAAIPAAASVRQQDQSPANVTTAREDNPQQLGVRRKKHASENAAKIVGPSTANENRDEKSDALAQKIPSTGDESRTETSDVHSERSGCSGGGIPFDRAAAAVANGGWYSGAPPLDRSAAALCVQRVFRGHKGRRRAGAEGRKRASQRASEREARMERERPHAASRRLASRLSRPKLPSTYGF